jgi:hypothetical protein
MRSVLVDARQLEMANDDAALAQRGGELRPASRRGWRAKMKLAADGRTSKNRAPGGRRVAPRDCDHRLPRLLEMLLVANRGDGAGNRQAIERIRVEAVLDSSSASIRSLWPTA